MPDLSGVFKKRMYAFNTLLDHNENYYIISAKYKCCIIIIHVLIIYKRSAWMGKMENSDAAESKPSTGPGKDDVFPAFCIALPG